jgi:hypothetical protein
MTDPHESGFRRIGRRDRKREVKSTGALFPAENSDDLRFAPPELREAEAAAAEATSRFAPPPASSSEPPADDRLPFDAEEETIISAPVEDDYVPLAESESEPVVPVASFIDPALAPLPRPASAAAMPRRAAALPPPPDERFPPMYVSAAPVSTPQPAAKARRFRPGGCLANLMTLVFLAASVGAVAWAILIYQQPFSALNPLPPFTPLPIVVTATFLPPTATYTPTPIPTATFTPLPVPDTPTLPPFPFAVANGGAIYIPHAGDERCNWSAIAGTVSDQAGNPLQDYVIQVEGPNGLAETIRTGQIALYGPGGFELKLGDTPQASSYTLRLFSPDGGTALSEVVTVLTRQTCTENVALVSFIQLR